MTQNEFQEKLTELRTLAEQQGGSIEKKTIEETFQPYGLEAAQLKLVYDYFLAAKIRVDGYLKEEETKAEVRLPDKQKKRLREYQEELSALPPETPGERQRCLQALMSGDTSVRSRVIELFLPEVLTIAQSEYLRGLSIGDLIQEGDLSLILAADRLSGGLRVDLSDAEAWIRQEIRRGMQVFVEERVDQKQKDRKLVTRAQDFRDGIEILQEEMGRKVYLDEVADFLNLSEDEVMDLLKLTGDEVKDP